MQDGDIRAISGDSTVASPASVQKSPLGWYCFSHGESDSVFVVEILSAEELDIPFDLDVAGPFVNKVEAENYKNKILKTWRIPLENTNITKKYRPLKFSQVIGQDSSIKTLTSSINSGIMPPAYLFYGTRGCGKTTSARLVAMALNCQQREGADPCGVCSSCKAIIAESSEYVIEVDGSTKGKIDDTRELMASIRYVVPDDHYKVIIIDECQGLSKAAWDSSLKTIEAPPPRVMFIFCTTEIQKVIATIKSRCTPVSFSAVADTVITNVLSDIIKKEGATYEDAALAKIVRAAGGSIRDGQTILEGFIRSGKVTEEDVAAIYQSIDPHTVLSYFNNIIEKNTRGACTISGNWTKAGIAPSVIVTGLLEHVRNMLMDWVIVDSHLRQVIKAQRDKVGDSRVAQWIDFFYDQLKYIRDYPMEYMLIMDLITIKLIDTLSTSEGTPKKKKESTEKEPKSETATKTVKTTATPTEAALPKLDMAIVNSMAIALSGTIQHTHPSFRMVTIHYGQDLRMDIVTDPNLVSSDVYFYGQEVVEAIKDFPKNMRRYACYKNVALLNHAEIEAAAAKLNGTVIEKQRYYAVVQGQNGNYDIVATTAAGVSPQYYLVSDLPKVLEHLPALVPGYLHTR